MSIADGTRIGRPGSVLQLVTAAFYGTTIMRVAARSWIARSGSAAPAPA
ncbi:hypothetical protein [Longimicrobium sp.]|nr:hypothetical protein [Longimicrobium sp.]HEX6039023.1 hypothetical protein [Longimicrobium sp.]